MHIFRTSNEIRRAPAAVPELGARIAWMTSQLEEHGAGELCDQVNIIVAGPGDRLEDVNADLGFDLRDVPAENVESQAGSHAGGLRPSIASDASDKS